MELEGEPIRFRPTHAAVFKKCKQEIIIIVFGLKFITEQCRGKRRRKRNGFCDNMLEKSYLWKMCEWILVVCM
jgi:hypothetical protein